MGASLRLLFPAVAMRKRGPRADNRLFLDALLWMARSGGRWRDLPERFGKYDTVKRRYYRWIEMGVLDKVLAALTQDADLEWLEYSPLHLKRGILLGANATPSLREGLACRDGSRQARNDLG